MDLSINLLRKNKKDSCIYSKNIAAVVFYNGRLRNSQSSILIGQIDRQKKLNFIYIEISKSKETAIYNIDTDLQLDLDTKIKRIALLENYSKFLFEKATIVLTFNDQILALKISEITKIKNIINIDPDYSPGNVSNLNLFMK